MLTSGRLWSFNFCTAKKLFVLKDLRIFYLLPPKVVGGHTEAYNSVLDGLDEKIRPENITFAFLFILMAY